MEPIKINVNVQVGVTEELYSLLRNLLPGAKPMAAPDNSRRVKRMRRRSPSK